VDILKTQTLRESLTLTKKEALLVILEIYGYIMSKTLALLCGLAILANIYIKINTLVLYSKFILNNSPLLKSGADFPYKLRSNVYIVKEALNIYALGFINPLRFTG